MTLVSRTHVPDEVYEAGRKHFREKGLLDLTFCVGGNQFLEPLGRFATGRPGLVSAEDVVCGGLVRTALSGCQKERGGGASVS